MKRICCTKLKSESENKRDITLEIHDIKTNTDLIEGFSIKSYLGKSDPTLVNPGITTRFTYEIIGCTDELMETANSIPENYIKRTNVLLDAGCELKYVKMVCDQFRKNISMLDENIILLLQGMLIKCFAGECISVKRMIDWYEEHDPLNKESPSYYLYKMKQFLSACALGMTPATAWKGGEDATGGFIVVKKDGDVVCFFIYDRQELYDYLIECTKFERPSSSKYGDYMDIRKENGKFYVDLCLQIRFVKPGHKFQKQSHEDRMFPPKCESQQLHLC